MGEQTQIGWTESTWNPWHGCRKVSPGCKYCYMYRDKERYGQDPTKVVRSKTTFRNPLKWADGRVIFTCSWSDWFIEEADAWRDEAWDVIRRTPQHTYQILTKRPERIADHLPADWGAGYPNVWLGVSCESQEYSDERIPPLLAVPAAVHFLSCEPLLGPIVLQRYVGGPDEDGACVRCGLDWTACLEDGCPPGFGPRPDWVIVGGESGPNEKRREMEVEWLRGIADECATAGIPLFVKQDSGPKDSLQGRIPADLWARKDMPAVDFGDRVSGIPGGEG